MLHPIHYEGRHFIIVNDNHNYLFYYFDFDSRSYNINMEFEHFHSYYEIHALLSPDAVHFIKGVPYHIKSGDFVLLPPSLLHKTCYPEGEPSRRLIITFMYRGDGYGFPSAYSELLSPFHAQLPIYRFKEEQSNQLNKLINRIYEVSRDAGSEELTSTHELMVHSIFTQFLYYLNLFRNENIYVPDQPYDQITQRIYAVSNYIHTHYSEEMSLEELAHVSYMSPYYLSHQFKKITGYTITDYIHMVRIRNCQYLLINSPDKVTEIAASCGFSSFSQFNRIFRRLCGEAPSEYRKRQKTAL